MMAGGTMRIETDEQRGQQVGSVIRMSGRFLGLARWLAPVYADWCLREMLLAVTHNFKAEVR